MVNGDDVSVKIFWLEKKIEINVGSKINIDHGSYRGGVKYTIFMKDNHNEYQKSTKRYIVNDPNFNWEKVKAFLNNHQNVNDVDISIISGIITTFILIAFEAILFSMIFY